MTDTMQAVEITAPGTPFRHVERPIPTPSPTQVRVAVSACGVCHSDTYTKTGGFPGLSYPRIPGHEIIGRVDAAGDAVSNISVGDRVGAGWHGGHCFTCEACQRGDFQQCKHAEIHGITIDGGYAEYVLVNAEAIARVPPDLNDVDAAPLLCAGVTTYNALRHSDVTPGDVVAIQGIGGLGHLALQYAHRSGMNPIAISHGPQKEQAARDLGASTYLDSSACDPAAELASQGGADLILTTAPNAAAVSSLLPGLRSNGTLMVLGVPGDPLEIPASLLVGNRTSVRGWSTGHAHDSEDTLEFSANHAITPTIETFPLTDVETAYQRMLDGDVRFRAVLEP